MNVNFFFVILVKQELLDMITTDITLFIQIVNMIVLMFLLNGVLYKPIRKILKERSGKTAGNAGRDLKIREKRQTPAGRG